MDILSASLLLKYIAEAIHLTDSSISLYERMKKAFKNWSQGLNKEEIINIINDLSKQNALQLKQIVEKFCREKKNAVKNKEECLKLFKIIKRLSKEARFLETNIGFAQYYIHNQNNALLDELLLKIKNVHKKNEVITGDWKLKEFLGKGNFGEVWLGENLGFPEDRVFKFFINDNKKHYKEWLAKEQENLSNIRTTLGKHPHLIEFMDVALEQRIPFIAMEYANQGSLEDWLYDDPTSKTKLNINKLMQDIISAMAIAHEKEIYHCDLKLGNILLHKENNTIIPKISDFGLAHIQRLEPNPQPIMQGTPMYLPPEAKTILEKVNLAQQDIFALGVIWYQLLTHKIESPPYNFAEVLQKQELDSATIKTISLCLANPEERFENAVILEEYMDNVMIPAWTPNPGLYDIQDLVKAYILQKNLIS